MCQSSSVSEARFFLVLSSADSEEVTRRLERARDVGATLLVLCCMLAGGCVCRPVAWATHSLITGLKGTCSARRSS
jgi:hypothetical protein